MEPFQFLVLAFGVWLTVFLILLGNEKYKKSGWKSAALMALILMGAVLAVFVGGAVLVIAGFLLMAAVVYGYR